MSENARLERAVKENWDILYLVAFNDGFGEFFGALDEEDEDKKRIAAMLKMASARGPSYFAPNRSKKLRKAGRLFELKPTDTIRLFYCYHKGGKQIVVITHVFVKKTRKTPNDQIDRGEELVLLVDQLDPPD